MKKISLLLVAIVVTILSIVTVFALTIDLIPIDYHLTSLHGATTDARTTRFNYQKIQNTPSFVSKDTDKCYLTVKAKRKNGLLYSVIKTVNFINPVAGVSASTTYMDMPSGSYKYELYNNGVFEIKGQVMVYISDQSN